MCSKPQTLILQNQTAYIASGGQRPRLLLQRSITRYSPQYLYPQKILDLGVYVYTYNVYAQLDLCTCLRVSPCKLICTIMYIWQRQLPQHVADSQYHATFIRVYPLCKQDAMRATSSLCTVCCCTVIVMCCITFPLQGPVLFLVLPSHG